MEGLRRMRPSSLIPCLFSWALVGFIPVAGAAEKPAPLSLSYAHAGLTEITVKDGKLHYVWHTERQWDDGKPGKPDSSSFASYDRHQVDVWLTDKELERFRTWVARHKPFEFDKDYPSASDGKSRGAAFQSGLTIVQGDRKHAVGWAGDSKTPKALGVAVGELIELADQIQRSRSK
jgi:hypothetical protein